MSDPTPDWSDPLRRLGDGLAGWLAGPAARPGSTDHPATCRGCPLCALLGVLRGERPEITEAIADVFGTAAAALRSLTDPPPVPERPAADERPAAEDQPAADGGAPSHPVQRIEVA